MRGTLGVKQKPKTNISKPIVLLGYGERARELGFGMLPLQASAASEAVTAKPKDAAKHAKWETLAKKAEEDEKEEKKEGDAALNSLFQQIYKDADEDTMRAMNKSFQESGGTVRLDRLNFRSKFAHLLIFPLILLGDC